MKQFFTFLAAVLLTASTYAQVGLGTINPDGSAALDITSTTQGLLPPRMTTDERDLITSAAKGLIVFNTTLNTLQINEGDAATANWVSLSSADTHAIGDSFGGGIVFFVYDGGQHGLIAATSDQSAGIRWYGGSYTNTLAKADGIGAGLNNTAIIIANQGPVDGSAFAATVCSEYSETVDGVPYGDWYLPSKYELNLMYENIGPGNVLGLGNFGNFKTTDFWSSTESGSGSAWRQYFYDGSQDSYGKGFTDVSVRAVRAF
jgi:hypothetical protein